MKESKNAEMPETARRIAPPAWQLWLLALFGVWQMGVIFYGSNALSLYGRTPLPVNVGSLTLLIVLGYIASIIAMLLWQRHCIKIGRVCFAAVLAVAAGLFLPLPAGVLAALFYIEAFLCVFLIGVMMTFSITLMQPESTLKYCIYTTVICGLAVSLLQNDIWRAPFWVFNALSLLITGALLAVFCMLPGESLPQREAVKKERPPLKLRVGIYLFIALSCLMLLFGSGIAEGQKNGVALFYLSGGLGGALFLLLWRRGKRNPLRLASLFLLLAGAGFLLAIAAAYYPVLRLPACILTGCGLVACNLSEFFGACLVSMGGSRLVAPMVTGIGLLTVLIQTAALSLLREDAVGLAIICGVIAVIGLMLYLRVEPRLSDAAEAENGFAAEAEQPAMEKTMQPNADMPPAESEKEEAPQTEVAQAFSILSPRERMLAQLIMKGYTMKEISERMGIEMSTQRTYRKNLYSKLDIHSRSELFELVQQGEQEERGE